MSWVWGGETWVAVALGIPFLVWLWIFSYSQSLKLRNSRGKVPVPGRFWQLPFFGETRELLRSNPDDFLFPRIKRYGPVFRTHLFGGPVVCVTSAEAAQFVLRSPHLFKSGQAKGPRELFGRSGLADAEGDLHAISRRLILAPLTPEALKRFTSKVDEVASWCFQSWGAPDLPPGWASPWRPINTFKEAKKFTFAASGLFICKKLTPGTGDEIFEHLCEIAKALTSLPIDVPGTAFHRGLQARRELAKSLQILIDQRRAGKGSDVEHDDLVDSFLGGEKDGEKFTDEQIIDNIVSVMFGAVDTAAVSITWLIRNLCLYPELFQQVLAENDAVAARRASPDDPITWNDLQQLPLTLRVVNETWRLANVATKTFRQAGQDVEYQGMLIPKGTQVVIWLRTIHLDSKNYPYPYKFDPDRFKSSPKASLFQVFGKSHRVCPGKDLAKEEMLIFLHRFTQLFEFEPEGVLDTKITYWPSPEPASGLPLRVRKRNRSQDA